MTLLISYCMNINWGILSYNKSAGLYRSICSKLWTVKLTTRLHLVSRSRMVKLYHSCFTRLQRLIAYLITSLLWWTIFRDAIKFDLRFVKRNKGYMNKHSQHEIRLTTLGTVPNLVEIRWLLLVCMWTKKHGLLNCAITYGCGWGTYNLLSK
jgi:hypothetical protein